MKKQTAVEWLQEPLLNILTHQQQMQVIGLFHQALAMEKYQIIDAYEIGYDEGLQIITKYDGPLDYFNKTYNNTQS